MQARHSLSLPLRKRHSEDIPDDIYLVADTLDASGLFVRLDGVYRRGGADVGLGGGLCSAGGWPWGRGERSLPHPQRTHDGRYVLKFNLGEGK